MTPEPPSNRPSPGPPRPKSTARPAGSAAGPKTPRPAGVPLPPGSGSKRAKVPPEVLSASKSARVGDYVKIQKIGTGSMGDVYRAWDLKANRWIALKILKSSDTTQLARFIREAQTASTMEHPNITAIYDAGKDMGKGLWFIAMQLVTGHTLKAFPKSNRRVLVELMRDAARAMEYAHGRGVVHRDIKPENFMVKSKPKAGVTGAPRPEDCEHHIFVMDFGIARPSDAATQLTMPGTVLGSPSYMSPEQASGRVADARADVYSLGATLYDLLTGAPPFPHGGRNVFDAIRRVIEEVPKRPRAVDPGIDAGLDGIVMKCLEKQPEARYPTAGALADALEGWLTAPPAAEKKKGCAKAAAVLLAAAAGMAAIGCVTGVALQF